MQHSYRKLVVRKNTPTGAANNRGVLTPPHGFIPEQSPNTNGELVVLSLSTSHSQVQVKTLPQASPTKRVA